MTWIKVPGDCPVMALYDVRGTRNTGYTDVYNNGGKYRYWIQSRGRDSVLGPKATIVVSVHSPEVPAPAAPTNVRLRAEPGKGAANLSATWNGHSNYHGYRFQWRRSNQAFDAGETGNRSKVILATNPFNLWEADGKTFQPASTTARRAYSRDANPNPWNTTYYVRVGTCEDNTCAIGDVTFASETSAHMGANPYD